MKKMILALATVAAFGHANAESAAPIKATPAWNCVLAGTVTGIGLDVIVGFEHLKGAGTVKCTSVNGQQAMKNVGIHIIGAGVGLGLSRVDAMKLITASVGVANGPGGMVGKYSLGASAGVTLINAGVDFDAALSAAQAGGLSFDLGLKGKDAVGLHVRLHGMTMEITELPESSR